MARDFQRNPTHSIVIHHDMLLWNWRSTPEDRDTRSSIPRSCQSDHHCHHRRHKRLCDGQIDYIEDDFDLQAEEAARETPAGQINCTERTHNSSDNIP